MSIFRERNRKNRERNENVNLNGPFGMHCHIEDRLDGKALVSAAESFRKEKAALKKERDAGSQLLYVIQKRCRTFRSGIVSFKKRVGRTIATHGAFHRENAAAGSVFVWMREVDPRRAGHGTDLVKYSDLTAVPAFPYTAAARSRNSRFWCAAHR